MASTAERMRAHAGPAILSFGFRPFFLLAALWAALAMVLWILALAGGLDLPGRLDGVDWHIHAALFGFVPAVLAGFLLTAIPNWTGRLPVTGCPLAALAGLWLAGRVAMLATGSLAAPLIDAAFLPVLAAVAAREIVAGRNWRNLKILVMVALLACANALFHVEGGAGYGARLGAGTVVLMLTVIGGRIVPSFTRNWLAKRGPGKLPASPGRLDAAAIAATVAALAAWVAAPDSSAAALLCALAGVLGLARLARWQGWRTLAEPLVTILHLGYLFLPAGFLLVAAGTLLPGAVPYIGIPHSWTAGAIGTMTLAVMTRASLGHSKRALTAGPATVAIYAAILAAGLARSLATFLPGAAWLLHLAAAGWIAAFAGFALAYGPMLLRPAPASAPLSGSSPARR